MLFTNIHLNTWDILLIVMVTIQATSLAYLQQPRWKAFVVSLPIPFTLMAMAAGRPLDATNALGLFFLLLFTHAVRVLHLKLHVPIIPAIILSALGYCVFGSVAARLLLKTDAVFWATWLFVFLLGAYLIFKLPDRAEPEYRTQLPVWVKLPIIAGVVFFLILARNTLQGFATVFPMVGVIAVYEGRFCLWTIGRQIPVIMASMSTMMAAAYLVQKQWGLPLALFVGWCAFLLVFGSITIRMWAKTPSPI